MKKFIIVLLTNITIFSSESFGMQDDGEEKTSKTFSCVHKETVPTDETREKRILFINKIINEGRLPGGVSPHGDHLSDLLKRQENWSPLKLPYFKLGNIRQKHQKPYPLISTRGTSFCVKVTPQMLETDSGASEKPIKECMKKQSRPLFEQLIIEGNHRNISEFLSVGNCEQKPPHLKDCIKGATFYIPRDQDNPQITLQAPKTDSGASKEPTKESRKERRRLFEEIILGNKKLIIEENHRNTSGFLSEGNFKEKPPLLKYCTFCIPEDQVNPQITRQAPIILFLAKPEAYSPQG